VKFIQNIAALTLLFSFLLFPIEQATAFNETAYDLAIINGRIVDGTGNPWFRGSIGIKNGKIVKVGNINPAEAKETVDAQGKIVAPGFIDVHTHVEDIYDNPNAENFVRMGVTSLVTGNCGGSATDIREFFGRMREKPLAVNLAALIGHNSVRAKVMGLDNRAPSAEEQAKMEQMVEQAMKDGAVGLSTGISACSPMLMASSMALTTSVPSSRMWLA
jgi:N-acyl-D-amino-acid deacylase